MQKQIFVMFPIDDHTLKLLKIYINCKPRDNCTCFCGTKVKQISCIGKRFGSFNATLGAIAHVFAVDLVRIRM